MLSPESHIPADRQDRGKTVFLTEGELGKMTQTQKIAYFEQMGYPFPEEAKTGIMSGAISLDAYLNLMDDLVDFSITG